MRSSEKEYLKESRWIESLKQLFWIILIILVVCYGFENYNLGIKFAIIGLLALLMDIRNYLARTATELVELNEDFSKLKETIEENIKGVK
ncbi:hypothetical protein ACFL52_02660 [Candidatus Margulisiibacteriota bacterium]